MGDIIKLRSSPIDLDTELGRAFIVDATRAGEGVISDKELMEKYELSPAELRNIAKNPAVGRAIRAERELRLRSGRAAKELAAKAFVKAPGVLERIMTDEATTSPRHRIEAARELRATANLGNEGHAAAAEEKFTIIINLGADAVEKFEFDHAPKKAVDLEQEENGNWG